MQMECLHKRFEELETRVRELDAEVLRLCEENKHLRDENTLLKQRVKELETTLENKADSKKSKKPKFPLNYGIERNKPNDTVKKQCRKHRKKSTGRVSKDNKITKADDIVDIFPSGIRRKKCVLVREQFVWRIIAGQSKFIRYRIHAPEHSDAIPKIPGVRHQRSEYGIEVIVTFAFLVYWIGVSIDKACTIFEFFTGLKISKGQADSLLNQLANDWEAEYQTLAALIVQASILYIDETGWKVGKKNCYTWIFSTMTEVFYKCGVGRGKDVLEEMLGERFAGTGVSDDYAGYDSAFATHQLCWAHPLRKALELSLRNPENKAYQRFCQSLFHIYYDAVRLSKDKRLSVGREEKAKLLESRLRRICRRNGETVITEAMVAKAKCNDPNTTLAVTSESEAKMIHLQKQLVEKRENMFVFVVNPAVEPTNNRSERATRPEAMARKATRTSKSDNGAKRRGIIMTVFASLQKRIEAFTLKNILDLVEKSLNQGIALFGNTSINNSG